jgi:Protein of unknown function (DUF3892)
MDKYVVRKVRMEWSLDGGWHQHIEGVCTEGDAFYTRDEVVRSLRAGDVWTTEGDGDYARIREVRSCNHPGCTVTPYITTAPDETKTNNLDELPRC